jgi:hypothetical protein
MTETKTIYVRLIDEDIEVWRPVSAEPLGADVYRIADQPYDRDLERWEFVPGDHVRAESIQLSEGTVLAATKLGSV